jgi:hypothetical protein
MATPAVETNPLDNKINVPEKSRLMESIKLALIDNGLEFTQDMSEVKAVDVDGKSVEVHATRYGFTGIFEEREGLEPPVMRYLLSLQSVFEEEVKDLKLKEDVVYSKSYNIDVDVFSIKEDTQLQINTTFTLWHNESSNPQQSEAMKEEP